MAPGTILANRNGDNPEFDLVPVSKGFYCHFLDTPCRVVGSGEREEWLDDFITGTEYEPQLDFLAGVLGEVEECRYLLVEFLDSVETARVLPGPAEMPPSLCDVIVASRVDS